MRAGSRQGIAGRTGSREIEAGNRETRTQIRLSHCGTCKGPNIAETRSGFDLLLSDVVMPGIDGPELACRLRAKWADLPVLFVTGYSADRLARSDALGPHDRVLEKPYQFDELARTIRQMLEARVLRGAAAG